MDTTRSFEIPNIALSGPIDNFKFYVSETDNAIPENNLYFNNLEVIPEFSSFGMILGALALATVARRR